MYICSFESYQPPREGFGVGGQQDAEVVHQLLGLRRRARVVVGEESPPLGDEGEEAAAARVVFRVVDHVLRDVLDAGREQGDLDLRRAGVAVLALELFDVLRALALADRAGGLGPLADLADVGLRTGR